MRERPASLIGNVSLPEIAAHLALQFKPRESSDDEPGAIPESATTRTNRTPWPFHLQGHGERILSVTKFLPNVAQSIWQAMANATDHSCTRTEPMPRKSERLTGKRHRQLQSAEISAVPQPVRGGEWQKNAGQKNVVGVNVRRSGKQPPVRNTIFLPAMFLPMTFSPLLVVFGYHQKTTGHTVFRANCGCQREDA